MSSKPKSSLGERITDELSNIRKVTDFQGQEIESLRQRVERLENDRNAAQSDLAAARKSLNSAERRLRKN